jgi:hypothetical protein
MTHRRLFRLGLGMLAGLLLGVLPLAAFAQDSAPAATEEPGVSAAVMTLGGTVTHGTGGIVPADLPVTLRVISPDMNETDIETAADGAGAFSFPDVTILADHIYVATVDYQGGQFASALLRGDQIVAETPVLSITLYDFTDDPAALSIEALQSQVAVSLNEMQVLELYRFTNSGDRAFRLADGTSVRVNIPENATLVDMGSARFLASEDGRQMIDTAPVLPGEAHTLHVLYTLPYGGAATVSHVIEYPLLNGFQVVIDNPGLSVTGDGIEPLGGGGSGMAFGVAASMPAGATVSYTISGVPQAAATPAPTGLVTPPAAVAGPSVPPLSIVLMILGGACIGIAGVLFFRERRRPTTQHTEAADPRVSALVQQIAELDVAFQAGTITQETYDTQRSALKSQLLTLARGNAEK